MLVEMKASLMNVVKVSIKSFMVLNLRYRTLIDPMYVSNHRPCRVSIEKCTYLKLFCTLFVLSWDCSRVCTPFVLFVIVLQIVLSTFPKGIPEGVWGNVQVLA